MTKVATAKIFQHGGSQAVRLPREFRLVGEVVKVSKTESGVLLEPLTSDFEARRQAFIGLAGSCRHLEDVSAHVTPDLPRDE